MKDFFFAIQDLFVNVLFAPFDALRALEVNSWYGSNIMSWLLFASGLIAFVYWMLQLKKFNDSGEEDKTISSHSFL